MNGFGHIAALIVAHSLVGGAAHAATHEVDVFSFAFEPRRLEIERGDRVRWTFRSGNHSSTADGGEWNSGVLPAPAEFVHRFEEVGDFDYHCIPHSFMTGRIAVTPGRWKGWGWPIAGLALAAVAATLAVRRKEPSH